MIKELLLSIILISTVCLGFTQSNEITIRFIGNCGLYITDGETHVYTDFPYVSGFNQYMEYDDVELSETKENAVFIFTHKHPDHYSKKLVKQVLKEKGGSSYGSWDIPKLEGLSEVIPGFKIQAFKTSHFLSSRHYSYLIEWHGKKIFLSGDTKETESILSVGGLEWAFVPAWMIRAIYMEQEQQIDSKMIAIYHIGLKDNIDIKGEQFLMLKKQGEVISIPY